MFGSIIEELLQKYQERHAKVPEELLRLLSLDKKSAVEKHCRTFVLKQTALVSLIRNAQQLGYEYSRQHRRFQPKHLYPMDSDMQSLRESLKPGAPFPAK